MYTWDTLCHELLAKLSVAEGLARAMSRVIHSLDD